MKLYFSIIFEIGLIMSNRLLLFIFLVIVPLSFWFVLPLYIVLTHLPVFLAIAAYITHLLIMNKIKINLIIANAMKVVAHQKMVREFDRDIAQIKKIIANPRFKIAIPEEKQNQIQDLLKTTIEQRERFLKEDIK